VVLTEEWVTGYARAKEKLEEVRGEKVHAKDFAISLRTALRKSKAFMQTVADHELITGTVVPPEQLLRQINILSISI